MTMSSRIRQALGCIGGALALFHGWLFAAQAASGRLDDPWLMFRWIAAALLVVALVALRRGGHSLWGRKGIPIWTLAALLHGPVIGRDIAADAIALPETVAASVLQLLPWSALAIGLLTLVGALRARRSALHLAACALAFAASPKLATGITPVFSSRPPPHCA
jgi:hypothetical protein